MDKKERNRTAILRLLSRFEGPTNSKQLAERLEAAGFDLSEHTVRLYLGELDSQGLTVSRGRRGRPGSAIADSRRLAQTPHVQESQYRADRDCERRHALGP